jgi:hypothetical protein
MANSHAVTSSPNRGKIDRGLDATRKTNSDGTKLPAVVSALETTTYCIDRSSVIASTGQNHCATNFNTVPNPSFITLLTGTKSRIPILSPGAEVTPAEGSAKPTAGFATIEFRRARRDLESRGQTD